MDDVENLKFCKSDEKRLEYVEQRIKGMQAHANETPEWDGDYAYIRNDEIFCLAMDFLSTISDSNAIQTLIESKKDCKDWPIRILMSFVSHMISNPSDSRPDLYPVWFDKYREFDPDPTYPR